MARRLHRLHALGAALRRWLMAEHGSVTIMTLFFLPTVLMVGGLALDVANAMRMRTLLQVTADAAAHAALYTREFGTLEEARDAAMGIVEHALPDEVNGDVVRPDDIRFGIWDAEQLRFIEDANSKSAVWIDLSRVVERDNGVATWLLKMTGFEHWSIVRAAVFETYVPTCFREGFVGEGLVDLRSNNEFYNGFCIHSNDHVELQQNNYFEDGTVVSMPDSGTIVLPASGFDKNEGLEQALRDGSYRIRVLNRLAQIVDEVGLYGSDWMPDYVSAAAPVTIDPKKAAAGDFVPGRIHTATCGGKGTLTLPGTLLRDMVIVTDCDVTFGSGATLENAVVATSSTDAKSVTASAGLQIGRDDDCAEDGGAQVLTLGGFEVASKLSMFGGQVIAAGDIQFAANADGIEGASMIAGGQISGTSNMTMGFCGNGMERNFEVDYFRLVL